MTQILHIDEIVSDPQIRRGRPMLRGTGLRVSDIVAWTVSGGLTPEQLAVDFELTLGQVHAALAYYHLHKDEIDAEMRDDDEEAERYKEVLRQQGRLINFD